METMTKNPVLAHWYYSVEEWEAFTRTEKKIRGEEVLLEALLITVLGTLLLHFTRGASWVVALAICMVIGTIYALIRYTMRLNTIRWRNPSLPEVIITNSAVIINGNKLDYHSETRWLRRADLAEKEGRNLLAITYEWQTRKGVTFDEIRIPIPKGRLKEGMEIQQRLNQV